MALSTTTNSGSQGTTQSPQSSVSGSASAPATSGSVQPGTATTLLTSKQGVTLHPTDLSTVSLTTTTASQAATVVQPKHHHVNLALISLPVILFLIALASFWQTTRSVKSTTK